MLGEAMKKPLIILDGFLILLIMILGLTLLHNIQEQSKESSISNTAGSQQNSIENKKEIKKVGLKINTKEVKKGNF